MPSITLTRLSGFDRNKKTELNGSSVVLGTDAGSDLRFDPTWDKTVSSRHASLEFRSNAWWLKDESKGGTYVDGRKVAQEKLNPGAVLELGRGGPKVRVDFTIAEAPAAPAPAVSVAPTAVPPPVTSLPVSDPPLMPAPAAGTGSHPTAKKSGGMPGIVWALLILVLIAAGAGAFYKFGRSTPDQALAQVAKDYADAVGLVVIVHPDLEGGRPIPMATAWAAAPRVFATNSHVSQPVLDVLKGGGSAYIVINRKPDVKLRITKAVVHPRYGKPELNFEGKQTAVPAYDVGLLHIDEDAPKVLKLAKKSELEQLDSGYRIGYLGFPMEGMAGGGVEVRSPVATMQSGIVTSVTDYWLAQANFPKRLLVQHNLGAAGGASGSPIFNADGEVVALLNAGNIIGTVSFDSGKVVRAPSGVMVNFAQRVDVLRDIWPDYPRD